MSSAAPLGNRDDLEALFAELGAELDALDATGEIVMVGGSWLLWHTQRAATYDVDSATRLDDALTVAASRVSARHDLGEDWLNDRAAMFWPADADYGACTTAHVTGGLTVKVPPARAIFVMKLYRAHPQDYEDMVSLWPDCGFAGPGAAAAAFRRAYPHAPDDEFLADYIAGIAHEAGAACAATGHRLRPCAGW